MRDIAHLLRPGHLAAAARASSTTPRPRANDRFVALDLLKNANIAAGGVLPIVPGHRHRDRQGQEGPARPHRRRRRGGPRPRHLRHLPRRQPALLADGAARHVRRGEHRHQPAGEIEINAVDGDAYKFLFMAKGGGSANKSYLFQETKALLNPTSLLRVRRREDATARHRGLPALPPRRRHRRHVGRVHAQDRQAGLGPLPRRAADRGQRARPRLPRPRARGRGPRAHASRPASARSSAASTSATTCGSIRLPRHGASLPGRHRACRCSADRQALGKITARRRLPRAARDATRPSTCPRSPTTDLGGDVVQHRPQPADGRDPRRALASYPVKTRLSLTGPMVVARDIAHAKLKERLDAGEGMPAVPARTTPSTTPARPRRRRAMASGSFGPTTAGRMDSLRRSVPGRTAAAS